MREVSLMTCRETLGLYRSDGKSLFVLLLSTNRGSVAQAPPPVPLGLPVELKGETTGKPEVVLSCTLRLK